MIIEATAPSRIDLAGGTLDIFPLYLFEEGGLTVNLAISVHSHVRLHTREDQRLCITSHCTGTSVEAANVEELPLYGDLDLSIIDELPPGRTEIKTKWLSPRQRQSANDFVRKQVAAGRQAFIICPLIEESEAIEAKAATTEYERLSRSVFPDLQLGLLHGRLSSSEKDEVMQRFRSGDLDILVSTPVVEVGVDIPNATVMLIEGADRFGLAQLHQFRGRVGRGEHESYCLLLAENPSEEARERLSVVESLRDGFALAEEDLRLRGPGEFFGTRQSGLPDLRMARLSDMDLLELARREAARLFDKDPYLQQPEHRRLDRQVNLLWESEGELA